VLCAHAVRVLVVSRSSKRFALARTLGAEETAAVADRPLGDVAARFSGREGVDVVVETAGTADAVSHALALVRPGGRVVLTGLPHEPTAVSFFSVVRREVTITGSMIYQDEFPEAVALLARGAVDSAPLLTHRFGLDAITDAFATHHDASSIKVAVIP
jgi:threonine dehydrogenase-like Zn-dependent dehydrogenase